MSRITYSQTAAPWSVSNNHYRNAPTASKIAMPRSRCWHILYYRYFVEVISDIRHFWLIFCQVHRGWHLDTSGSMTQNFGFTDFWACAMAGPYTGAAWNIFGSPNDSDDFLSYSLPLMKKATYDFSAFDSNSAVGYPLALNSRGVVAPESFHNSLLDRANAVFIRNTPELFDGGGFSMGPSICNTILEYEVLMGGHPRAKINPKTVISDFAPGLRTNNWGYGIHGAKLGTLYNYSSGNDANGWPLLTSGYFLLSYTGTTSDGKTDYHTAYITFDKDTKHTVRRVIQFLIENPNEFYTSFYFEPTWNYQGENHISRFKVSGGGLKKINIRQRDNN